MLDLFKMIPSPQRRESLDAYRSYLKARDGTLNLEHRTLSLREDRVMRFEQTPARVRALDRQLFTEQYAHFDPARPTPPEVMLLLTMTKINAGEAYGVSVTIDRALREAIETQDDLELNLLIEETYHTRILLSSARLYDIRIDDVYTPPAALRMLIGAIVHAPRALGRCIGTCGEIIATLLLGRMLSITGNVLRHDAELRDAVDERIMDVLIDEIGHVSFNRLHMGAASLKQTLVLLPIVARGLGSAIPELRALGAAPSDVLKDLHRFSDAAGFPEQVRRAAFFA